MDMPLANDLDRPARRSAGRPRCSETHCAILEAAADLLETEPYRSISIDRIAARAQVGKQTIYRWWATKADLILEAYLGRVREQNQATSPSGDALADLRAELVATVRGLATPAGAAATRALYAEAQLDPEFRARFNEVFIRALCGNARSYVAAGIAAGTVRADVDADIIIDIVYGAVICAFLSAPQAPEPAFVDRVIAAVRPWMEPMHPTAMVGATRQSAPAVPSWMC